MCLLRCDELLNPDVNLTKKLCSQVHVDVITIKRLVETKENGG